MGIKERMADSELDIMRVFWHLEKAMKASEITKTDALSTEMKWKKSDSVSIGLSTR